MSWPPISLDTPIGELADAVEHVAAAGIGVRGGSTVALLTIRKRRGEQVKVTCMDIGLRTIPPAMAHTGYVPATATLAEVLLGLGQIRATAAGQVPDILWPGGTQALPAWLPWVMWAAVAVVVIGGLVLRNPVMLGLISALLMTAISTTIAPLFSTLAAGPAHVRIDGQSLMLSQVLARLAIDTPTGPSPAQRVDQVKARYGELLGDIRYRIENSALFDSAHPPTQRFELALVAWDPSSDQAEALATEVEQSFTAAISSAEQLGLTHLPSTARDTARRAVKAVSIATASNSTAERKVAAQQAAQLLDSLALYWLPKIDPDIPSLIGSRKMLGPAS